MSSQPPSNPFNDFIQNFMMLNQVKHQREQMDLQRKQGMIASLGQYLDMARTASDNPEALDQLDQVFIDTFNIPAGTLKQIRENVVPLLEVQKAAAVERGVAGMTPEQTTVLNAASATGALAGQTPLQLASDQFLQNTLGEQSALGQAFRTRLAAGMSPGEMATDVVRASMPTVFHENLLNIESGQAPSAAQIAQNELGWANLRLDERLGLAELGLREDALNLDRMRAKAADRPDGLKLIEEYGKAVRSLTETRASRSKPEITAATGLVNTLNQQLVDLGYLEPRWYLTPKGEYVKAEDYTRSFAAGQGWKPIGDILDPDEIARKNIFERRYR